MFEDTPARINISRERESTRTTMSLSIHGKATVDPPHAHKTPRSFLVFT